MQNSVSPENVKPDAQDQRKDRQIDNPIALAARFVEGADPLFTEIDHERRNEAGDRRGPKIPPVLSVEDVSPAVRCRDGRQPEQDHDDRRQAAEAPYQREEAGEPQYALPIPSFVHTAKQHNK